MTEDEKKYLIKQQFKNELANIEGAFIALMDEISVSRETSLAKTNMNQATMWAEKAIERLA